MTPSIRKVLTLPAPPERVWRALADRVTLAEWMFPNDFEPRVGHAFTFHVPPNPEDGFDGLEVRCVVLVCDPPRHLEFSWSAGGPVEGTRVRFRLEPDNGGTRLEFEHSGFDFSQPWAEEAVEGAAYGWATIFERLTAVVAVVASEPPRRGETS